MSQEKSSELWPVFSLGSNNEIEIFKPRSCIISFIDINQMPKYFLLEKLQLSRLPNISKDLGLRIFVLYHSLCVPNVP